MAVDMFLKFGDLKGESQVKGFENQIQLLSWQWGMTQTGTMHRGSGGGTGRVNVQDLTFEHYLDAATPSLVAACCTGAHFSEATLTLRKAGGSALDYYVIKLTDLIVSAVSAEDNAGDELVREWVGLNFAAFEVTYQPQDQKGAKRGGAIVKQYDIAKNSGSYLLPRSPAGMNGAAQLEETYKKGNEQFDYVICASTTGRGDDEVLRHSVFGVEMSRVVLHPNGTIDFRITRNRIGLDAAIRSGLQGCVPSPSNALKAFLQKATSGKGTTRLKRPDWTTKYRGTSYTIKGDDIASAVAYFDENVPNQLKLLGNEKYVEHYGVLTGDSRDTYVHGRPDPDDPNQMEYGSPPPNPSGAPSTTPKLDSKSKLYMFRPLRFSNGEEVTLNYHIHPGQTGRAKEFSQHDIHLHMRNNNGVAMFISDVSGNVYALPAGMPVPDRDSVRGIQIPKAVLDQYRSRH